MEGVEEVLVVGVQVVGAWRGRGDQGKVDTMPNFEERG